MGFKTELRKYITMYSNVVTIKVGDDYTNHIVFNGKKVFTSFTNEYFYASSLLKMFTYHLFKDFEKGESWANEVMDECIYYFNNLETPNIQPIVEQDVVILGDDD